MRFKSDKDAYASDLKEHITYNQKIAKAKNDLRHRLPPRAFKRKELWQLNNSRKRQIKIIVNEAWRKFDLKTRGMGFYLLCLMGIMVIVMIVPHIAQYSAEQLNKTKYESALKTSCLDTQFYTWNFQACEDLDVRPETIKAERDNV